MIISERDNKGHFIKGHSFRKGLKQSEKTKCKIRERLKGTHPKSEFKKGHKKPTKAYSFPKGHKVSDENIRKLIERNKGKKASEETRKRQSEAKKGKSRPEEVGRKIGDSQRGMKKKPCSEERKRKIGDGNKGKKHTEEHKRKMREWMIEHPNRIFKDTKIELKVEAELIRRGINYQKQIPLCKIARVDFYLPEYRIVIQADGAYWHNYPFGTERDRKQDAILTLNGFNIHRFWEKEINKDVVNCINKLLLK